MGRILKVVKHGNGRWGKDAKSIIESFVTNSTMKKVKYGSGASYAYKETRFSAIGSRNTPYRIGATKFYGVGNSFGCREGLTRDLRNQNGSLSKNSVLVVKHKMPVQQVTYRTMIEDGWVDFLKEFLGVLDVDKKLIELCGIYKSDGQAQISFPLTKTQGATLSTVAGALVMLIRNPSVFCRSRGKKGMRNHREVIEELVHDQLAKRGRIKMGVYSRKGYTHNTANFVLWNILFYLGLLQTISKNWRVNMPNGQETYVVYGSERIANALMSLNENERENFFDLLGGKNSPIIRSFPSSISLAIEDMAAGIYEGKE